MDELERKDRPLTAPEAGVLIGGGVFAGTEAVQRTAGYFQELTSKLNDLPPINPGAHRNTGVRQAWQWEKLEVELGGTGSRPYTAAQRQELMLTGKVDGMEMHHINSVQSRPDQAGHPDNLEPVNFDEHLARHDGNFQNETSGPVRNRLEAVEQANLNRVLKAEMMTAIGVGAGAFLIGSFTSWAMDREAGWRTHVKRGAASGGLALVGYGVTRGAGLIAEHLFKASSSTIGNVMVGAGLGLGMIVSGIVAYQRGLRGWALAREVGWTGSSGLITYAAAAWVKGALFGAAMGPLGMLVGAGVAIVVGLALEGVRRWWQNNDMSHKVGEWAGEGARFLKEAGRAAVENVKAVARAVWEGAKWAADQVVDGVRSAVNTVKEVASSAREGAKSAFKSIFSWRPRWGW